MSEEARGRGKIGLCAFCREPNPTSEEDEVKRTKKLVEAKNAHAIFVLGGWHDHGDVVPQDHRMANELYLRAGELGCADAYCNLGNSYLIGEGVEVDMKKAKH